MGKAQVKGKLLDNEQEIYRKNMLKNWSSFSN